MGSEHQHLTAANLFECIQCGDCCKGYGGTYLTAAELAAIADYLNISAANFIQTYCVLSGKRPVLAQRRDGYCIFWDQNCTIHPVKPTMCRNWPFIAGLLVDIANWHTMAASCPGMRSDIDDETLLAYVRTVIARR